MKSVLSISFFFCCFLLLLDSSISLPLCVDSSEFSSLLLFVLAFVCVLSNVLVCGFPTRLVTFFHRLFLVGAPLTLNQTLEFCPYNGSSCCNSTEDAQIEKQFQVNNVSDPACASVLKSILCAVRFCYFRITLYLDKDPESYLFSICS